MHVEVRIDDGVVMLGEGDDDVAFFSSMIHVYVPDVADAYQRALETGGIAVQAPLQREDDPDWRGMVKDPERNIWVIATQVD